MAEQDVVREAIVAIRARYGNTPDISTLPPVARNILLVNYADYLIGNGGFQRLFEQEIPGDPGYRLMLSAHTEVGAEDGADAIAKALRGWMGIKPSSFIARPFNRFRLAFSICLALWGWDTSDTLYLDHLPSTRAALENYAQMNESAWRRL